MLSQNDVNWKLKRINGTNSTIGSFGCLITCICFILQKAGYAVTPEVLAGNKELFDGDMWVGWDKLQTFYPNLNYVWGEKCLSSPAPIDKILSEIKDGYYPIIMLDYSPKVTGMQTHYLVVIDSDSQGNLKVGDPWDGAEIWLDTRYGTLDEKYKILKVDTYHFTKPPVADDTWNNIKQFLQTKSATEGTVREAFGALSDKKILEDKVSSLQTSLTDKQTKLVEKDKIISDLKNELDGANTIINTKNSYREKLSLMLGCTGDWDEIVRNVAVAIGNEDKYTGLLIENRKLLGEMDDKVKNQVEKITFDLNLKLNQSQLELVKCSNNNNALQKQVNDLKSIINGGRKTLLDKIKSLFKLTK